MSLTGTMVQHYRVGEQIGSGGMGEVYKAEDTRLGRFVALKFLAESDKTDADRRARFIQEARAASALQSPNIVATYDVGEHNGAIFTVMEYIDAEPLSTVLKRGPLPIEEAIDVAMQLADALDYAHGRGVIHRDISTANLLLTERKLVKVLDFGIAKFVSEKFNADANRPTMTGAPSTVTGEIRGTLPYMSPEQALGRQVDARSDLFSAGCVLYELITGRRPFQGETVTEVLDAIVRKEPEAIARFNYDVPATLESIVRKALQKDPNFRHQSARDLYVDLHNVKREIDERRAGRLAHDAQLQPDADRAGRLEKAIAVIPFANVTRNPEDEWIGTGLAETISSDLNIEGTEIIGRERLLEAIRALQLGDWDASDEKFAIGIGRRLGAAWIVSGGYQRAGDQIRVTARVIDVGTGSAVRSVKIDGVSDRIFELQDRVVQELAADLKLERAAEAVHPPTDR